MINVRDALLRVPGIAAVDLFGGAEYGMRIWLNPTSLHKLGLHARRRRSRRSRSRTSRPRRARSAARPSPTGQEFTYTVQAPGRLTTPEEFERHPPARRPRAARRSG